MSRVIEIPIFEYYYSILMLMSWGLQIQKSARSKDFQVPVPSGFFFYTICTKYLTLEGGILQNIRY